MYFGYGKKNKHPKEQNNNGRRLRTNIREKNHKIWNRSKNRRSKRTPWKKGICTHKKKLIMQQSSILDLF